MLLISYQFFFDIKNGFQKNYTKLNSNKMIKIKDAIVTPILFPEIQNEIPEFITCEALLVNGQKLKRHITNIACFTSNVPLDFSVIDSTIIKQVAELFVLSGFVDRGNVLKLLQDFSPAEIQQFNQLIHSVDTFQTVFNEHLFGGKTSIETDERFKNDERIFKSFYTWENMPTDNDLSIFAARRNELMKKITHFIDNQIPVKPFFYYRFSINKGNILEANTQYTFCVAGNLLVVLISSQLE
jgi:hypothetical protein